MFNSRNSEYRNPTGAVKFGTKIHFKIKLPRHMHCSAADLIVMCDNDEKIYPSNMFWCGMVGEHEEWWECHYTAETPGLYFYHFELQTDGRQTCLYKDGGGNATLKGRAQWPLTVFKEDYKTPDWLSGGIMYQIFPDRFYNSGTAKHNVPCDRETHDNWSDLPEWRPNGDRKITNHDFFGGDLEGIQGKLPYLKDLGVTCIYLNPIFEAYSNHRYDTGNYSKIDPILGTEEDFKALCSAAKQLDIHIMLDGVFSHTGSDSIYFNRENRYDSPGAYNSKNSPYFSWYTFKNWPDKYDCWWDFITLPNVDELNPHFNEYINGENGIIRKWLRAGASGWRLDVADELPDEFLDNLRKAAKAENPDAVILGEVWEDASTKAAYGVRRRYLQGDQLDTVMNYPFREAIFAYLLDHDGTAFFETVESILENYPQESVNLLMNHIGTHDTIRAITILGGEPVLENGREWQSCHRLSEEQYQLGVKRLKLASLLQYMLPGVPCVYYGDEVGVEGYKDPFSRKTFPWDNMDTQLLDWYTQLGKMRHSQPVLKNGNFRRISAGDGVIAFSRYDIFASGDSVDELILFINGNDWPCSISDEALAAATPLVVSSAAPADLQLILGSDFRQNHMQLEPFSYALFRRTHKD